MKHLCLQGNIQNILFCRITEKRLKEVDPAEAGFSFGLGALRQGGTNTRSSFGELVTLPGMAAVVPAEDPGRPIFTSDSDSVLCTPFRCCLRGVEGRTLLPIPFSRPVTARHLWERASEAEKEKTDRSSPLLAGVLLVELEQLRGAYVQQNPTPENAPENGKAIIDPSNHSDWFGVNPDGGAHGSWAVVVGVGLRQEPDSILTLKGRDEFIFYRHPDAPPSTASIAVHQHAVLLEGVDAPQPEATLGNSVSSWLEEGKVVDVKHVLEDSLIRRAWGSFFTADDIELDRVQD